MSLAGKSIGRYLLKHSIGRGGMGEVYLADDTQLRRQVAIKVILSETALYSSRLETEEASRLFLREARAIAQLDHPHILPIFDYGEAQIEGRALTYMVMPFRSEGSFADWLRQRRSTGLLQWEEVSYFIGQAATALEHAHQHNITHQDIKPSNFLIRRAEGTNGLPALLLTDFGIARFLTETVHDCYTSRGTPAYMAPEQWRGNAVPASDQYALAVMAYELLTGQLPFRGLPEQVMYQHLQVQPLAPAQRNPNLPAAVNEVLLRALAKKPEERFASVAAFANALHQALQDEANRYEPTVVRPLTPVPPPWDAYGSWQAAFSSEMAPTILASAPRPRQNQATNKITRNMVLLLLVLLLLGGSTLGLFAYFTHANARTQGQTTHASNTQTTTPTSPTTASPSATSTPGGIATATPGVSPATIANPYPPYTGTLVINDPLIDNTRGYDWNDLTAPTYACTFNGGSYHVIQTTSNWFTDCFAEHSGLQFANFAFQARMSILSGDCGGLVFRANPTEMQFYFFRVCQDGTYDLRLFVNNTNSTAQTLISQNTSPAIHTGLNALNLLAVTAQGNQINLYINQQLVHGMIDNSYTIGKVAVAASSMGNSTEVIFNNALLWTQ